MLKFYNWSVLVLCVLWQFEMVELKMYSTQEMEDAAKNHLRNWLAQMVDVFTISDNETKIEYRMSHTELGRGSGGVVYAGESYKIVNGKEEMHKNIAFKLTVDLKKVLHEMENNLEYVEPVILKKLQPFFSDPNTSYGVVHMIKSGKIETNFHIYYIILEQLDENLYELMERLRDLGYANLTRYTCWFIARNMIKAIFKIPEAGVIYRDFKLENVMTLGKKIKIVDFDKAKMINELKKSIIVGTLHYMSKNGHLGHTQNVYDDLSQIVVMVAEIYNIPMSWNTITEKKSNTLSESETYNKVLKLKEEFWQNEDSIKAHFRSVTKSTNKEVVQALRDCFVLVWKREKRFQPTDPFDSSIYDELQTNLNVLKGEGNLKTEADLDWIKNPKQLAKSANAAKGSPPPPPPPPSSQLTTQKTQFHPDTSIPSFLFE